MIYAQHFDAEEFRKPCSHSSGNVYSASEDNTVRKIDSSGSEVWSFTGSTGAVLAVAVG